MLYFSPRRCTPTSGIILEQFYLLEASGALSSYQRKQKIRKMSQQNNRLNYYRYHYQNLILIILYYVMSNIKCIYSQDKKHFRPGHFVSNEIRA